jgi:hypothetical protein
MGRKLFIRNLPPLLCMELGAKGLEGIFLLGPFFLSRNEWLQEYLPGM